MLTNEQIEEAKKKTDYSSKVSHGHHDCIRIAYEWLDAQKKVKSIRMCYHPLKHLIEAWGGLYVSQADVEVAATLHPEIRGEYPNFNLSLRLTEPADARLQHIELVFSHKNKMENHNPKAYKVKE